MLDTGQLAGPRLGWDREDLEWSGPHRRHQMVWSQVLDTNVSGFPERSGACLAAQGLVTERAPRWFGGPLFWLKNRSGSKGGRHADVERSHPSASSRGPATSQNPIACGSPLEVAARLPRVEPVEQWNSVGGYGRDPAVGQWKEEDVGS